MSLHQGEIIRYEKGLWRVDLVNDCRARIVPLGKRDVANHDYDPYDRGVNISPNSPLEVIVDVERTKAEIELAEAEADLRVLQAELAQQDRQRAAQPAPRPATLAPRATRAGGWLVGPAPAPLFKEGSLAACVMACITTAPGQDTKTYVSIVKAEGNVAACISRFFQAGYIHKEEA